MVPGSLLEALLHHAAGDAVLFDLRDHALLHGELVGDLGAGELARYVDPGAAVAGPWAAKQFQHLGGGPSLLHLRERCASVSVGPPRRFTPRRFTPPKGAQLVPDGRKWRGSAQGA